MKLKTGEKWLILVNVLGILGFTIFYLSIQNYEFLLYIAVMVFFLLLILFTLRRTNFDYTILFGLSIWGYLHMAGGGIRLADGGVLYGYKFFHLLGAGDSYILKYDQVVHLFGFGVATLVFYHLLESYLNNKVNWKVLSVLIVLGGMGVGAFNEIIEYVATLISSSTGVGGYDNTMIDIIFNTIGAIIAVTIIRLRRKKTL